MLNNKIDKFTAAALFYMCLQLLLILKFYILGNFKLAYYFCYHAPLLFSIAFFKKDITLIQALIIAGFVGQIIWIIDYSSYLTTGSFILGNSKFVLRYEGIPYVATIASHFLSTLLALFLTRKSPISRKTHVYAFIYFFVIYALNIIHIIPESYNVNFVWHLEGFDVLPFHTKLYLLYIIPIVMLPGYYVQILVKKIYENNLLDS